MDTTQDDVVLSEACQRFAQQVEAARQHPVLSGFLDTRRDDPPGDLRVEPLVLFGGTAEDQVLSCWRTQLRAQARAVRGIVDRDRATTGQWLYWGDLEGPRIAAEPFLRCEQLRDCGREARSLVRLLTSPRRVRPVRPGEMRFQDTFEGGLGAWSIHGGGDVDIVDRRLRIAAEGVSVWCGHPFTDAVIAFDYTPLSAENPSAGALFAFPGTPVPGQDYAISGGPMERYNTGIDTYHCSLFRGGTGRTNLRRTGPGLKMLSTVTPDACAELGRTYRVELLKLGSMVQVLVDGRLIHAYVDVGTYGPVLTGGRFGIRHFSGGRLDARYGAMTISDLV
ncbi:MAG: DUF1961 family protein [Planctomycetes bacterium]|nr:DUF1961 family protein [Planctomycetota bacterium]